MEAKEAKQLAALAQKQQLTRDVQRMEAGSCRYKLYLLVRGMSASCNRGSNCSLTREMDGRIVRCGIISSRQSAATSEIAKRFWSRVKTRVRGPIASARLLPLQVHRPFKLH